MTFDTLKRDHNERCSQASSLHAHGSKFVDPSRATQLLETVIRPGDRVCLEGDNQKQADFLARALLAADPVRLHGLHLVQSSIVLPEHIELIEKGIVDRLDFAFSGPQARPLYKLVKTGKVQVGAIHTYLELYARYFMDLFPRVSLVATQSCDAEGNLFCGMSGEDTPVICEATHVKSGIVIAQVERRLDSIPRVDVPADQVDFIIETGRPAHIQPLFTRDPAKITEQQILMAMMVLGGIYAEYTVKRLNHGLGYATAAIELLLPTVGSALGLRGRCCTQWVLNPHPTLIPAIEDGYVEHVYSFGGEPGMSHYVRSRPDVFAVGAAGHLRSNRCYAHVAGLYAIDCFTGATLQIDRHGNSSTAIEGMIAGFGGAPNLGSTPPGRRHVSPAFKETGRVEGDGFRGRKLVVQVTPTVSEKKGIPVFVDELDAERLCKDGLFEIPPIMITGDQITHIVTEQGIAYLHRCRNIDARRKAIAAVAGDTEVGRRLPAGEREALVSAGLVKGPSEFGIDVDDVSRDLLAAQSLDDIVEMSGGLYEVPPEFR